MIARCTIQPIKIDAWRGKNGCKCAATQIKQTEQSNNYKKKSKSKYCIIATRRREIIIFVRRAHPTTPQARFTRTNGKALRRLGSPKDTPEPYCCARQGEEK